MKGDKIIQHGSLTLELAGGEVELQKVMPDIRRALKEQVRNIRSPGKIVFSLEVTIEMKNEALLVSASGKLKAPRLKGSVTTGNFCDTSGDIQVFRPAIQLELPEGVHLMSEAK